MLSTLKNPERKLLMTDLGLLLDGKQIPLNYLNLILDRVRKNDERFNLCPLLGSSPSLDLWV